MILTSAALLVLSIVLLNALFWPRVRASELRVTDRLSVLIPARNEEHNLPACLDSILEQGSVVTEVLMYNDHSTDGTSRVIDAYTARDPRFYAVAPEALPNDWCGKNFACAQLALAAHADWILFLDADVRLARGAANGILQAAIDRRLTLLSCWPGFEMKRISERVLMPLLNFVVFTIYPSLLALVRPEPSLGLAHGACMLMRRDVYLKLDGHSAVRNEIFEDTRLAQLWRERGERSLCLDGQDVVRVRMYENFQEIWRGFQKNFYPAFRHSWMFWIFEIFHFVVFLLPFLLGNLTAMGLVLFSRVILAARFGQPLWSALLHPVAEGIMLVLGLSSWWHCHTGRGVAWKGRVYRARQI